MHESFGFGIPPNPISEELDRLRDPDRTLILQDLTEKIVDYNSNNSDMTGTTPTEDDFARVALEIYDADGNHVGRTEGAGRMLFRQGTSVGNFVAFFGEVIKLDSGTVIRSGGLVDDARLTRGEAAGFPAVAVDGPFKGAIGYRTFKPLVKETHDTYVSSILLYLA